MSTLFIIDFYLNYIAWEDFTAFYFSPLKFVEILLCPKDDTNFWKCWKHTDWNACSVLVGGTATVLMICLCWPGITGTNAQFFQYSLFFCQFHQFLRDVNFCLWLWPSAFLPSVFPGLIFMMSKLNMQALELSYFLDESVIYVP